MSVNTNLQSNIIASAPTPQFMSLAPIQANRSILQVGVAVNRVQSEAFDSINENAENFRRGQLKGGIGGIGRGSGIGVRTFTCSGNPICIPIDIITLCHCCTGSVCCGCRPCLYDRCCFNLFKDKTIDMDEQYALYCCCDWRADWGFEKDPYKGS